MARKGVSIVEVLIALAIFGVIVSILSNSGQDPTPPAATPAEAGETQADREARELIARLEARLTPDPGTTWTDGLAAVVLVDVSGSMHDRIKGDRRRKIEAAQAATVDLVGAFAKYAAAHPELPVRVGIHEFSARAGAPACFCLAGCSPAYLPG